MTVDTLYPSGIEGLDDLLGGGIPNKFWLAVIGPPGSFKTICGIHFMYQGLKNGEQGIYVVTEELEESIIRQATSLGMDLAPYKQSGDLKIVSAIGNRDFKTNEWDLSKKVSAIANKMGYSKPKRLVIDSIAVFWADKPAMSRKIAIIIKNKLVEFFSCCLLTVQVSSTVAHGFGYGADFLADTLIHVGEYIEDGEIKHWVQVRKMRERNHDRRVHHIKVKNKIGAIVGEVIPMEGRGTSVADLLSR